MTPTIEYRVRPVTRYLVTRFETSMEVDGEGRTSGHAGSSVVGEFHTHDGAKRISDALALSEAQKAPFHLPKVYWEEPEPIEEPKQELPA